MLKYVTANQKKTSLASYCKTKKEVDGNKD